MMDQPGKNIMSKQLKEAYDLAVTRGDYDQALAICDALLDTDQGSVEVLKTRAQIYAHSGDFHKAIDDVSTIIDSSTSAPDDYFSRARWHIEVGNPAEALDDLNKVIEIGEEFSFHYYTESAFFYRAVAWLRLGHFKEAISDCQHVREDFLVYMRTGKISRADIIRLALTPQNGRQE